MANIVKLKRSATASAVPTTAQLQLGELAMNTFDGKLFLKKNNGTESIVEIGAGGGGASVTISTTAPTSPTAGDLWWNSEEGKLKIYYTDANSSQWVDSYTASVGATGTPGDVVGPASSTDSAIALFDGTTGKVIKNSGVTLGSLVSGAVSTKTTLYTTGSGTFTTDPKTLYAQVICTGGGGGGGGADSDGTSNSASGGGGGGGTAIKWFTATELGASAAYVIGTGGTAGTVAGGVGGNGTASTFDPAGTGLTLTGGFGSGGSGTGNAYGNLFSAFNGGSGGAGTNGDFNHTGLDGSTGLGFPTNCAAAGNGGASYWGGGANGPVRSASAGATAGTNATIMGAGGSGAVNTNAIAGVVGGTGADGEILIVEYLSA